MLEQVELQCQGATLVGVRHNSVSRFGRLRYAEPPVDTRRFAAPMRAAQHGTVDATGLGTLPPQLPSQLARVLGPCDAPQSEDCLHLTIWTPGTATPSRPVIVWCHGGAWQSGGVLDWYNGEALALRGDVVVVAISARLGPLGWLYANGVPPNLGLQDLTLAFGWINENIAAFGGDPDRITAMGQSAGGVNVAAIAMRQRVPFHRAILQSAPLDRPFRSAEAALEIGRALLQAAGATDIRQSRRLPVNALLRAQLAPEVVAAVRAASDGHGVFAPVADGEMLAGSATPLGSHAPRRVDALVGWNHDEMRAFTPVGSPAEGAATRQHFEGPARRWAERATDADRDAWLYRFDGTPEMAFGACHCAELPFVFGTLDAFASAPMVAGVCAADAERLTSATQDAWLDFVHGRPLPWKQGPHAHIIA